MAVAGTTVNILRLYQVDGRLRESNSERIAKSLVHDTIKESLNAVFYGLEANCTLMGGMPGKVKKAFESVTTSPNREFTEQIEKDGKLVDCVTYYPTVNLFSSVTKRNNNLYFNQMYVFEQIVSDDMVDAVKSLLLGQTVFIDADNINAFKEQYHKETK